MQTVKLIEFINQQNTKSLLSQKPNLVNQTTWKKYFQDDINIHFTQAVHIHKYISLQEMKA